MLSTTQRSVNVMMAGTRSAASPSEVAPAGPGASLSPHVHICDTHIPTSELMGDCVGGSVMFCNVNERKCSVAVAALASSSCGARGSK